MTIKSLAAAIKQHRLCDSGQNKYIVLTLGRLESGEGINQFMVLLKMTEKALLSVSLRLWDCLGF